MTFNGHLVDCDNFMNVTLRDVYETSADGERFWKMKEMFIKGNVVSAGARGRSECEECARSVHRACFALAGRREGGWQPPSGLRQELRLFAAHNGLTFAFLPRSV